jgi:hypothetical protein
VRRSSQHQAWQSEAPVHVELEVVPTQESRHVGDRLDIGKRALDVRRTIQRDGAAIGTAFAAALPDTVCMLDELSSPDTTSNHSEDALV